MCRSHTVTVLIRLRIWQIFCQGWTPFKITFCRKRKRDRERLQNCITLNHLGFNCLHCVLLYILHSLLSKWSCYVLSHKLVKAQFILIIHILLPNFGISFCNVHIPTNVAQPLAYELCDLCELKVWSNSWKEAENLEHCFYK